MSTHHEDFFASYAEWREAMIHRCGIPLTPAYCAERLRALRDPRDASTAQFIKLYGAAYCDKVIGWLQRAGKEM